MIKLAALISFLSLSVYYIERALHSFQQNRYELDRFSKWLLNIKNYKVDTYFYYVALSFIFEYLFNKYIYRYPGLMIIITTLIFTVFLLYSESKKTYIKPLVYTNRVKRQVITISILDILYISLMIYLFKAPLMVMVVIVPIMSWLLIYLMAIITKPIEEGIKKNYENQAKDILYSMNDLKKIGITGSYGKTSTKNVLNAILNEEFYTLMTPASYNTPMGITKTIRELLKPIHEVFLCEMGADHVGDIDYLMDFVRPNIGILTSIGPQHLNTFKSLDNIIKEKMTIIEKLPSDGLGIINLDNEYIQNYHIHNDVKIVSVGINSDATYKAYDIAYDSDGTSFKVDIDDNTYEFKTLLLGKHNIINLLLGIALANELNIDMDKVKEAIANLKPIEHRLELKNINGYRFIDNAFNSNPVSSKLSLDVLSMMPNKRIIVTPGLIDLGKDEDKYNTEFGRYMLNKCDFVILVGHNRSKAIIKGLKEVSFDMSNVLVVNNVFEAFNFIYQNFTKNDTILLENDLPDAFSN